MGLNHHNVLAGFSGTKGGAMTNIATRVSEWPAHEWRHFQKEVVHKEKEERIDNKKLMGEIQDLKKEINELKELVKLIFGDHILVKGKMVDLTELGNQIIKP